MNEHLSDNVNFKDRNVKYNKQRTYYVCLLISILIFTLCYIYAVVVILLRLL